MAELFNFDILVAPNGLPITPRTDNGVALEATRVCERIVKAYWPERQRLCGIFHAPLENATYLAGLIAAPDRLKTTPVSWLRNVNPANARAFARYARTEMAGALASTLRAPRSEPPQIAVAVADPVMSRTLFFAFLEFGLGTTRARHAGSIEHYGIGPGQRLRLVFDGENYLTHAIT